jgi:16S rRNA (guanine966-N2)-methyltransferase
LKAEHVSIYAATVPTQLRQPEKPFDVVFLDPPYQANLLFSTCRHLEENYFLADSAYIYLEAEQAIEDNDLPSNWRIIKSKLAGQVAYHLAFRERENKS